MNKIILFTLSITILLFIDTYPQTNYSVIQGKITDEKGESLPFANVILKEINNGSASDKNGFYKIVSKPGTYTLEVSYIGYEKVSEQFTLQQNRIIEADFVLKSISFEIGGIEVTADNDFIPLDATTKTKVSSGEIEHIQASSLNDVMELTPGVKTSNPTLNTVEKAVIRGGDALGTQIIMDGVPVSNNANLQVGIGQSTANSGVDLRSIPAENIKEVEIIRGIPSAKYGDLVDGLLLVKTKAEPHQPRIKFKYNPNLYESNISSGLRLSSWVINGNLNIASSDRDFRVEGDGYTRLAAQVSAELQNDDLELKNIFYVTRAFDEKKEVPGYALREAWYNRDLQFKYTGNYNIALTELSEINSKVSVSLTNQDSYNQQIVSRDNIVISDRIEEGAQEGRIVFGSYLGKKTIKGEVWNLYADLNYQFRFFTGDFLHSWIAGGEWKNDFNKGAGIIFDPLYPPSLSIPSPRIRTYGDIPAYNILSIYAEDKITGNLLRPFTLQAGLRYEVYRPEGLNISGLIGKKDLISSSNGSFLNPRLNFSVNLFEKTQARLSYGIATKSPPLGMIAAQDRYYDYVDTNSVVNPQYPDSNFAIISTYIRQQANPQLKAYKQTKYEASIDQQIADMGFTFTYFINNSTDEFSSLSEPTVFYKRRFPDWPDQSYSVPYDTIVDTYTRYTNGGWRNIKGVEFSFRTRKIPLINTIMKIDAAYTYGEYGSSDRQNFGTRRFFNALGIYVLPVYNSWSNYYKDLLINYRFEIQAQSLGMWLTLHVQQQVLEIDGREGYADTLAAGYFTNAGDMVMLSESERLDPRYNQLKRNIEVYELYDEDRPNKWLLNLKVTKSLWDGAAISFYVNNFLNNRPVYSSLRRNPEYPQYERRNIDIFYGIEFHSSLSGIY
jgi:outer membrane receptor for ferrienterochelin and colicin